jgi:hypothetical protein
VERAVRAAALVLLAAACAGPGTDPLDGERGTVAVAFAADEVPEWIDALSVRVEQVVLDGYGPAGPASVAVDVGAVLTLVGDDPPPPVTLVLPVGAWAPAHLAVHLSARDGEPAVRVVGDGEHGPLALEVLEVSVDGDGALEVGSEGAETIDVTWSPGEWDELREVERDDDDDDDEPIRVDPAHHRDVYDEVLDAIVSSTRVRFPGADD